MSTNAPSAVMELEIDGIAAGGDGVGRDAAGRVVFVPLTAPGDRVRTEIVASKARWARGVLREVLVAAEHRREPPCEIFGRCGGCRLQHLSEVVQVEMKRRIVQDALQRIGGISREVAEPIRAGDALEYRNRITLTARGSAVGYRALGDPATVVRTTDCLLAEPPIRAAVEVLSNGAGLPTGGELRVTLRASSGGNLALYVEGGAAPGEPGVVAARLARLESYWWRDSVGRDRLLHGAETFRESLQGLEFDLPPTVFLQCNRHVSQAMDGWLDERVGSPTGLRIIDLYAGVGARAIRWALLGGDVVACETDAAACEACRGGATRVGGTVEVVCGRADDHPELLGGADVVIVNPPRSGLAASVREALMASDVARMAYVSCDPATLARDLKELATVFEVLEVQPFDAFPQTAHVEIIVWMSRVRPASPR
ncbi:MAG: class I SAM-dependent RNA methyltransferase [Gemmatimonadota bacterium]